MDSSVVIQEAPAKGRRKFVLTLDGGGVRGLATLLILERLMWTVNDVAVALKQIPPSDRLMPHQIFDLAVGTSTGGLIATMLGKLNMNVPDCITAYRDFASQVFGNPNTVGNWTWGALFPRYDGQVLHDIVQKLAESRRRDPILPMIGRHHDHEHDSMNCGVVCNNEQFVKAMFFCNSHCSGQDSLLATVAQAAQATTAAPSYFGSVLIGNRKFFDGGPKYNNPSEIALDHYGWRRLGAVITRTYFNTPDSGTSTAAGTESLAPSQAHTDPSDMETSHQSLAIQPLTAPQNPPTLDRPSSQTLRDLNASLHAMSYANSPVVLEDDHGTFTLNEVTMINIGTGWRSESSPKKSSWLDSISSRLGTAKERGSYLVEAITESEKTAEFMRMLCDSEMSKVRDGGEPRLLYQRFSPDNALCHVGLDEYKRLDEIEILTNDWLRKPEIEEQLRKLAWHIVLYKFPSLEHD